jgi:hypothetical protein
MAQYWALQMASGIQSYSEYYPLHQQRCYLLDNLANEEARREHLENMLEVSKVKLVAAQSSGQSIRPLKKLVANTRRKLMSSQNTEKFLVHNLAVISARMNSLEQTQWRRAALDHNRSLEYGQLDGLTAGMQNMVVSPIKARFPTAYDTSGFVSPISPMFVQPWTSLSAPTESYQLFSPTTNSPPSCGFLLQEVLSQPPGSDTFRLDETLDNSSTALQIDTTTTFRFPAQDFVPAKRALSLPDISAVQHMSLDNEYTKEHMEGVSTGLTRQLSLVNHPSSGLRMQRMFS